MGKKKGQLSISSIPRLNTPRSIADDNNLTITRVLSVIFVFQILPTALADETPLFDSEASREIIRLARRKEQ